MKISIITTIYKAESDLPRLLESMMAQQNPKLEFFLINNGSPDRCGEICEEYARKDNRFVIHTIEDNIGYIRARNLGIQHCSGDFIGFCDSDDYLEPAAYDRAFAKIETTNCDLYITSWRTHYSRTSVVNNPPYTPGLYVGQEIEKNILPLAYGPLRSQGMLHGFAWKQIVRKSVVGTDIRFDELLKPCEDQLFNVDVIMRCNKVCVDNNVLYNYIVNESSITNQIARSNNYDVEWNRLLALYDKKMCRANSQVCVTATANSALVFVCYLIQQILKQNPLSIKLCARIFKNTVDSDILSDIIEKADWYISMKMCIVRFCLRYKLYKVLFGFINVWSMGHRN